MLIIWHLITWKKYDILSTYKSLTRQTYRVCIFGFCNHWWLNIILCDGRNFGNFHHAVPSIVYARVYSCRYNTKKTFRTGGKYNVAQTIEGATHLISRPFSFYLTWWPGYSMFLFFAVLFGALSILGTSLWSCGGIDSFLVPGVRLEPLLTSVESALP